MKLLVVTQYFYPENFKINDLVLSLADRGHQVEVLTGLPNYPGGQVYDNYGIGNIGSSEWKGIKIHRVPLVPRFSSKGWQLAINYISFVYFASMLGPLLCKGKYDHIFVYEPSPFTVGIPAVLMRYIKSAPLTFWVQDLWPESLSATGAVKSPFVLGVVGWIVRKIYQSCDHVLVQSRAFYEPAVRAGAIKERISYFPNWAEDFYQPINPPAPGLVLPAGFKIIFAGNMGAAQSLETIVNAAERLYGKADIHWIMVGDGRRRQWMMDEAKRLDLEDSIIFTGRLPAEQMPAYFSHADALLVTLTDEEIFSFTIPAKIQAYLACGKPIVAALNGEGARIVKESRGGYLVAAGDAEALANAVFELYSLSDDVINAMCQSALEYSRDNFDKHKLISQLESILLKVPDVNRCVS